MRSNWQSSPAQRETQGEPHPAYIEFFAVFNRGEYFHAHEVLEVLWLSVRGEPVADFYKGLIQVAGAFVHLQKGRLQPAVALFRLAEMNLGKYPARLHRLDIVAVCQMLQQWREGVENGGVYLNPYTTWPAPQLMLRSEQEP